MDRNSCREARYGNIPGLPVGSRFTDRAHLYRAGMHATLQAGIQGRAETGACSIVLSGGYEDDADIGYEFTYTGQGGQLPRQNTDRSQKKDQEWTRGNLALKMSCVLRKPVRVIRGHKLQTKWAPAEGYRYDGLYDVVEYDRRYGKSGFYVCLFRLQRRPNQPPIPEESEYSYRAGERPPTSPRSNTQTPPPRTPPPRYSLPADIKAILEAARNRPSHARKTSVPNAAFKEGSSRERPASLPARANKLTHTSSMSTSAYGNAQSLGKGGVNQKQQLPPFTYSSSGYRKPIDPPKRSMSYPNPTHSSNPESSAPSASWKGKQKANEPEEMGRAVKYPDSSMRIQAWNNFYNQGPRNEQADTDDDSDTDGGEFSEGDGLTYRDTSDTEHVNQEPRTVPFNGRIIEVIDISSDED